MAQSGDLRIGISGWTYTPWRKTFYPDGLAQRFELAYASTRLNSIEINGSFYSLQRPTSYRAWYDATPEGFVFSVKGGRYITHLRRLRDVQDPLANFFASGILELKEKLGPILWQFPPNFKFDAEKFETFFNMLPTDTQAASALAKRHTGMVKGRASSRIDEVRPVRHAIEIRHPSFRSPQFIDLLRRYNLSLVVADTAGLWPYLEDVTADFVYIRLHGEQEIYASGYTHDALDRWGKRIELWRQGKEPADGPKASPKAARKRATRDVFVYFDNDKKVHAPYDAMKLAGQLGITWTADHEKDTPPIKANAKTNAKTNRKAR